MENRAAFLARLEPRLAPSDLRRVKLAYTLAKSAHRWQVRKSLNTSGGPTRYFEHLRGTAIILMDEAVVFDPELVVVALFHDGIEDTDELDPETIEEFFGRRVSGIVRRLTKEPKDGYVERLRTSDFDTRLIKACDRLHNLRSLDAPGVEPEFKERQLLETRQHYAALFQTLLEEAERAGLSGVVKICREILSF